MNLTFVLNFGHPVRQDVLDEIPKPYEILNIPCQLTMDSDASLAPIEIKAAVNRAAQMMSRYDARLDGTSPIIVILPSINDAVALILAMLHGRLGHFPRIIAFRRSNDTTFKSVNNMITCRTCHGRGSVRINEVKCKTCNGVGCLYDTTKTAVKECDYCQGTGMFKKGTNKCLICNGKGWVQNNRLDCPECKGKGTFFETVQCETCTGTGIVSVGKFLDLDSVRNSAREQGRHDEYPERTDREQY